MWGLNAQGLEPRIESGSEFKVGPGGYNWGQVSFKPPRQSKSEGWKGEPGETSQ